MKKLLLLLLAASCATSRPAPVARKDPHPQEHFGETLQDDYFWLRNKGTPEVEKYLNEEAAYADAEMEKTKSLQEKLYGEMLGRVQQDDSTAPYRIGAYTYWYKTEKGKQYPTLLRKSLVDSKEEVLLDENAMAAGKKFFSIGRWQVSDDGNLLAYSTDDTGYRQYKLHVRDLRSRAELPESMERVTSFTFSRDSYFLFYVIEDEVEKRSYQFYRHELGKTAPDELLYEEKDHRFRIRTDKSRSKDFIFLTSASHTTSEVRYFDSHEPRSPLTLIEPRKDGHEYYVDARGGIFWIRTNSGGRNFRVVTTPVFLPGQSNWREVVPHRDGVMIDDVDCFRDFVALYEREGGLPQIAFLDPDSGKSRLLKFPEIDYDVRPSDNPEWDQSTYRLRYESFVTPPTQYDADIHSLKLSLVKQQPVPNYNYKEYAVERVFVGTVPVSLVHRKDAPKRSAMLLSAYGSYGISNDSRFDANVFSLADRGITYAVAHIRGGGEFGKAWHDDGRMMNKLHTFEDFIACAEGLIDKGYTSKQHLAITGGSAGGLLMGAVLNMRPDLFEAALVRVPFVDVINTMLDESLPLTVGEFEEWGNPKLEVEYKYMRSYSPYDNVKAQEYPAMLVKSSYNDSQVMYWEPSKWVARLRAMKTDHHPLLFKIDMNPAGHGGASGRYDRLHQAAYDYSFVISQIAN